MNDNKFRDVGSLWFGFRYWVSLNDCFTVIQYDRVERYLLSYIQGLFELWRNMSNQFNNCFLHITFGLINWPVAIIYLFYIFIFYLYMDIVRLFLSSEWLALLLREQTKNEERFQACQRIFHRMIQLPVATCDSQRSHVSSQNKNKIKIEKKNIPVFSMVPLARSHWNVKWIRNSSEQDDCNTKIKLESNANLHSSFSFESY